MTTLKTLLVSTATAILPLAAVAGGHGATPSFCENAFFPGDQNTDGFLDPTELAENAQAVFAEIDVNKDGALTREEYVACTEKASPYLEWDAETIRSLDENLDEVITAQEYFGEAENIHAETFPQSGDNSDMATSFEQPFVYLGEGSGAAEFDVENRDIWIGLAAVNFNAADANSDRQLTRDEWVARADDYQIDISEINQKFDMADATTDGMLSLEEFVEKWNDSYEEAATNATNDGFTDAAKGVPAYYFYIEAMS
ncbi:EF-hand domain-containing protein [Yoonia litorea]|uniref:EF hand n=1 Tax=Yoonia litorea TaxID=1123755 RepID=A0A1I6N1X8_9RHOB|nr:EF-hand domain-containing protein [Yoonia litorea]SFS21975.1 EF hand [Yoonia litorea]